MKKFWLALLILSFGVALWYFGIRSYEFEVRFKSKTTSGDIIQALRIWSKSLKNDEILLVDSIRSLKQVISVSGRKYLYRWEFSSVNDSVTQVSVKVTEPGKSLVNKLLVPVKTMPIETDAKQTVEQFHDVLRTHLKITRVAIVGETITPEQFCVCRELSTLQTDKAYGMMKDYTLLTSFISSFNLVPNGRPIVKVKYWNHSANQLKFDFCFPIAKPAFLPASDSVSYKTFEPQKVLKAIYNGNYITSDRAWYSLAEFATRNHYEVSGLPVEHYFNNPNLGFSEKDWRADIYLPIK